MKRINFALIKERCLNKIIFLLVPNTKIKRMISFNNDTQ